MIARVWYGWTDPRNADDYEAFVTEEVLPEAAASIDGCVGSEVFRRDVGGEVEFVTVIRFESLDAVRAFAGDDYETAHVPERARDLLSRWDEDVAHYEVAE